jgi:hypothetical protein
MAKINAVHVLGSGILAGMVINLCGAVAWETILGNATMSQLGRQLPGKTIPMSMGWGLMMGVVAVWLYVSLRAHYGAGARTAALAGGVTWTLGYALPSYAIWAFGIVSGPLVFGASGIALAQILLATLAGAAFYDVVGDRVPAEKASDAGDLVRAVPLSRSAVE